MLNRGEGGGGFLAVDLGAALYAGSWVAGERLTPQAFMDASKRVYGSHPGFRRNRAKGVAVSGYFDSTGAGQEVSKAAVFRPGRTPVVGRFSLSGGMSDGRTWRTAGPRVEL
ncbi:MAG: catalase [Mycobacterium sp.]|jgi:catalase|nr:catalase [Mycobacterium sp.]MDT5133139.1 catalase [Mycobacterium sp.]